MTSAASVTPVPPALSRRLASNLVASLVAMALRLPVTFLLTPFLLAALGDARFGTFGVLLSLLAYLNLAGGPLHSSTGREYAHAGADPARRSRVLANALVTSGVVALLTAAVGIPLAGPLVDSMRVPPAMRADAIVCFYTLIGTVIASQLATPFLGLLMSANRYDLIDLVPALGQAVYAGLAVLAFTTRGASLALLGYANLAAHVLGLLALVALSLRHLGGARLRRGVLDWQELRAVLGFSGELLVINLSVLLTYQTDNIVISRLIGVAAVAHYTVASSLITRFRQISYGLSRTFMPATADPATTAADRRELHFRGTRYATLLVVVLGAVAAGVAVPFYERWLGPAYRGSAGIFVLLIAANLVAMSQYVTNAVLTGLRHTRPLMVSEVVAALANLGLSIALVKAGLGLKGVALGTLVPMVLRNAWLAVHGARVVDAPLSRYLRGIYLPAVLVFALTFVALRALAAAGWIATWPGLFAAGAAGLALAGVLTRILVLDAEDLRFMRGALRARSPVRPAPGSGEA
jgi:O-antigen/teichoic acid export membrane protein